MFEILLDQQQGVWRAEEQAVDQDYNWIEPGMCTAEGEYADQNGDHDSAPRVYIHRWP